jgi:hypothetical protein
MSVRRVLVVLAVAAAAGCSGTNKAATPPPSTAPTLTTPHTDLPPRQITAQQQADEVCRKATPKDFVNALPTTIGAIHAITGGPPGRDGKPLHPYTWLFPALPDQMFAAWCWHQPTPHNFKLLVVAPSGQGGSGQVTLETGQGSSGGGPPRPGPLAVT